MLSRVAENVYWLSRQVERAENTARLINVNGFLAMDLPRSLAPGWEQLIIITGSTKDFEERYPDYSERSVVKFLISDASNHSSIISTLSQARENARTVRDTLPRLSWELLTGLYLYCKENMHSGLTKKGRYAFLTEIIRGSHLLAGMLEATMTRDAAYQFLRIGRNLERADMTTRILDVRTSNLLPEGETDLQPFEAIQWMSVLKSLSAYHMYRKRVQTQVSRPSVLRFLLQDDAFPRAFRHSLLAVEECLGDLPNSYYPLQPVRQVERKAMERRVLKLKAGGLHRFIDELQHGLGEIHSALETSYFLTGASQIQTQQQESSSVQTA